MSRPSSAASVLLAFPHARMRMALAALLGADPQLEVAASVGDVEAAAQALRRHRPDIVVADLSLVSMTGGLLERWGPVPAGVPVVVASFEAPSTIEAPLRARGAAAYVSKEHLADGLPAVLHELAGARAAAAVPA